MSESVKFEEERQSIVIVEAIEPTLVIDILGDEKHVNLPLSITAIQTRIRRSRQGSEGFADISGRIDLAPLGSWSVMVPVEREAVESGDARVITVVIKHLQAILTDSLDVMVLTERPRPQGRTIRAGVVP